MGAIKSILTLVCAVAAVTLPNVAATEGSTATLEGTIRQSRGTWVLRLPTRLSLTKGGQTGTTRDLQLVGYSDIAAITLHNLDGRQVRLHGRLDLARSPRHVEPVVFVVSDAAVRKLAAAASR
jgi:hypothetical protein